MAATAHAVGALKIPTVTLEDLFNFHALHFPSSEPVGGPILNNDIATAATEEDDLGYYSDGVKRTLTDQQIAMFRHSEIQSMLRKREKELEAAEDMEDWNVNLNDTEKIVPPTKEKMASSKETTKEVDTKHELKKKKRRRAKNNRRSKIDGEWTPRRVAREQDSLNQNVDNLDYG